MNRHLERFLLERRVARLGGAWTCISVKRGSIGIGVAHSVYLLAIDAYGTERAFDPAEWETMPILSV